jgi:hypothetical protein
MKGKLTRIDEGMDKALDNISVKRIVNGLERNKISRRELTRMALNTESWHKLSLELETKMRKTK